MHMMEMITQAQCNENLVNFRYGHWLTRNWLTTTQWWKLDRGYACVVVRGLWDKCVVCMEIDGSFHAVEANSLVEALRAVE